VSCMVRAYVVIECGGCLLRCIRSSNGKLLTP
jgi:hypothetical protein